MVNGMHTTLAFVTLCKEERGAGGLQGNGWKDHVLLTPDTASKEEVGSAVLKRLNYVSTFRVFFVFFGVEEGGGVLLLFMALVL